MRLKSSKKKNWEFYENEYKNLLYDFAELYGLYLAYQDEKNYSKEFEKFYKEKLGKYSNINKANKKIRENLDKNKIRITSRKLKRMLLSGSDSFVYVYECLPEYIDAILKNVLSNSDMKKCAEVYILNKCINKFFKKKKSETCADGNCQWGILDFQYAFLTELSRGKNVKKAECAKKLIGKINQLETIKELKMLCER